jgi:aspartokinase
MPLRSENMPPPLLIVQKYGGTSVGNVERIAPSRAVASRRSGRATGRRHRVGDVGETNRLLKLAKQITEIPTSASWT